MCNKEKFWGTLAEVLGKPEWIDDPELNSFKTRLVNRDKVTKLLDDVLSTATTEEWIAKFGGRVPVSPVYDVGQALESPFAKEKGTILEQIYPDGRKIRTPACPVRFSGVDYPKNVCPEIGANTDEILQALGYDQEKVKALKSKKVI
jgi:crotonobetainyl-CoA:carnitine CoA-transferase CaiB-like acyl-CoA transferase